MHLNNAKDFENKAKLITESNDISINNDYNNKMYNGKFNEKNINIEKNRDEIN